MANEKIRRTGLCITRRLKESVVIDTPIGQINITFVGLKGYAIRLLFESPENVKIFRREIYDGTKIPTKA